MNEDASPLTIAAPSSIHPIHEPVEGSMIAPSLHIGSSLIEGQPQLILSQPQLIQTSNEYLHNKLGGYQGQYLIGYAPAPANQPADNIVNEYAAPDHLQQQ